MLTVRTIEDLKTKHSTISLEFDGNYLNSSLKKINNFNNGSWLYPHAVDNFITLITTNKENPSIQLVAPDTVLDWKMDIKVSNPTDWDIAFIKMILIDKSRQTHMKKTDWEEIFDLSINDMVAPDGTLFVGKNEEGVFSVKTQSKITSTYLIKYSVDFHHGIKTGSAVHYKLDPTIKVHDPTP